MSDRGKKRRKKRYPFDFGSFDKVFEEMWEDLISMLEGFEPSLKENQFPNEEFSPLVWGLRMNIGTDGKPRFEQFGNTPQKDLRGIHPSIDREPLVDVIEEEEVLRIIAEVPGVSKEEISLSTTENRLLIEAKSNKRNYFKELELPVEVIPEDAKARFKNGVLEVTLKRKSDANTKSFKRVNVEDE